MEVLQARGLDQIDPECHFSEPFENVEQWHRDLLATNPVYCWWGNFEDYMWTRGRSGWNSAQEYDTFAEFGPWGLDELNECVNFYFDLTQGEEGADPGSIRVGLQLWILHPRKGCSRGVYVRNIRQEDLPSVFAFLRTARDRNAERFARVPA